MGILHYNEETKTVTNVMADRIYEAFKEVELGDGIGYHEANCIDDYLEPTDPIYIKNKEEDERKDWRKVYQMIEDWEGNYNHAAHCFMDAKGLHFFLPVMLRLGKMNDLTDYWFWYLMEEPRKFDYSKRDKMLAMLTPIQQQCLLDCFEMEIEYDETLEYLLNYKGRVCCDCGKIHDPISYTLEEAREEIEDDEKYKVWKKLKEILRGCRIK